MVFNFEELLPEAKLNSSIKFVVFLIKEAQIKQNTNSPSVAFNQTALPTDSIDLFWQQRAIDLLVEEEYISIREPPWPVEIHLSETHSTGMLYYQIQILEPFDKLYKQLVNSARPSQSHIIIVNYQKRTIELKGNTYTYKRDSNEVRILFYLLRNPSICISSSQLFKLLNNPRTDAEASSNNDRLRDVIKSIRNKFGKNIIETCFGGYTIPHPIQVQD